MVSNYVNNYANFYYIRKYNLNYLNYKKMALLIYVTFIYLVNNQECIPLNSNN